MSVPPLLAGQGYESNPWLRINLGATYAVGRVQYQPREPAIHDGRFLQYEIYVTESSSTLVADWGPPVASGTWSWGIPSDIRTVDFPPKRGRYVILRCIAGENYYANCNEVWIYSASGGPDSDQDGLPDWWESQYGLNPLQNDAYGDYDSDGIPNIAEYQNGTSPIDAFGLQVFTPLQ